MPINKLQSRRSRHTNTHNQLNKCQTSKWGSQRKEDRHHSLTSPKRDPDRKAWLSHLRHKRWRIILQWTRHQRKAQEVLQLLPQLVLEDRAPWWIPIQHSHSIWVVWVDNLRRRRQLQRRWHRYLQKLSCNSHHNNKTGRTFPPRTHRCSKPQGQAKFHLFRNKMRETSTPREDQCNNPQPCQICHSSNSLMEQLPSRTWAWFHQEAWYLQEDNHKAHKLPNQEARMPSSSKTFSKIC